VDGWPLRLLPRARRLGAPEKEGPADGLVIRCVGSGWALPFGHASHATRARQPPDAPLLLRDRLAWEAPRQKVRGLPLADLHGQKSQRRLKSGPRRSRGVLFFPRILHQAVEPSELVKAS
jgi:hypothetical protein